MNGRYLYILLTLFLLRSGELYSQKALMAKADQYYESFAYGKAAFLYKKILNKREGTPALLTKIANSYYFNADYAEAEPYYRRLMVRSIPVDPELYLRYAHTLKAGKKYKEANLWMGIFASKKPEDSRTKIYQESMDYLMEIKERSGRYTLDTLDINTVYNDFGPSFDMDRRLLVFATGINSDGTRGKLRHSPLGMGFYDLYAAPMDSKYKLKGGKSYPLVGDVNTRYHESTATFAKDGKTMYFTRNNHHKGKTGKTADGRTLLKIYKATRRNGQWQDILELPFGNDEFSVAHPALSGDEKRLYFSYSGPGSMGSSDIYYVDLLGDNEFGVPKSLGSRINTEGRESFPFVTESNLLFYASDGKQGLGALDIYVADLNSIDEEYFDTFNVGAPINSEKDDFAFVLNEKQGRGFFTSNRDGGKGADDIYGFAQEKQIDIKCEGILKGIAKNATDFVLFTDTTIVLLDDNGNELKRVTTNDKGEFAFDMEDCRESVSYQIKAIRGSNVWSISEDVVYKKNTEQTVNIVHFSFPKSKDAQRSLSEEITRLFEFEPVYFAFGSADLEINEAKKLLEVVRFLKENPEFRLRIESHTDNRSSDAYNQLLSERRGQRTKDFLVYSKIDADRIIYKGFGEARPTNPCTNEVRCTEMEHGQNRRCEFFFFKD